MVGISTKASDIFIVGGQPTITYNPRKNLELEERLKDYLETGYKLLSVTGPTKCGKTVLIKAVIPRDKGIWISGGQIVGENDLWNLIIDDLQVFTDTSIESSRGKSHTSSGEGSGELNLFGIAKAGGKLAETESSNEGKKTSSLRQLPPRIAAIKALENAQKVLIIDDFHYINRKIQLAIIRALKNPIFEGLRVITIAVPHRAYDAARVEGEMTGRLVNLDIPLWNMDDLIKIPESGFPKLNIVCSGSIATDLANQSFGSPHLMQEFCRKLGNDLNENRETTWEETIYIDSLPDFDGFFKSIGAASASKVAHDRLVRGPRQRSDRVSRSFKDGTEADIYVAVMRAIAHTGPKTQLTIEEIRAALKQILNERIPQGSEVTRVLTYEDFE